MVLHNIHFNLIQLFCDNTKGTVEEFQKVAYIYKNKEAISHMFQSRFWIR